MFSASFYNWRGLPSFVFNMFSASFYSDILACAKNVRPVHFTAALPRANARPGRLPSPAECHLISLARRQAFVKRKMGQVVSCPSLNRSAGFQPAREPPGWRRYAQTRTQPWGRVRAKSWPGVARDFLNLSMRTGCAPSGRTELVGWAYCPHGQGRPPRVQAWPRWPCHKRAAGAGPFSRLRGSPSDSRIRRRSHDRVSTSSECFPGPNPQIWQRTPCVRVGESTSKWIRKHYAVRSRVIGARALGRIPQ